MGGAATLATISMLPPKMLRFVPDDRYTLEQYLAIERETGKRYEYHDGHLISVEMMAGGSPNHSRLSANAIKLSGYGIDAAENESGRLSDCDAHTSDLRISVDSGRRYLYADAVIVCGAIEYDTVIPTAIVNPITVFEVISPSSEGYDRGLKFDFYGALDSVREYVLVDQERRRVEVRHRTGPGAPWQHTVVVEESGACPIPSLGFSLAMSRLYRNWEAPA